MKTVRRFDKGELSGAHKTKEGYVYAEGYATRAGVFLYQDREGNIRRELRPPAEVGAAESLASLARKPVTDLHPKEFVDASNIEEHGVGSVDPEVVFEQDYADGFVRVKMTVSKKSAVDSLESGRRELSCGYTAEMDETPGAWTDAAGVTHKFDAIQRNIRYNHLALVDNGRAGAHARLRLDSDAVRVSDSPTTNETEQPMATPPINDIATILIGGQKYRADEYPAIQRAVLTQESRADSLAEELAEMAKKVAEYEIKMADMEKEMADIKAAKDIEEGEDEPKPAELDEPEEEEESEDRKDWANERFTLIAYAKKLDLEGFDDVRTVNLDNAEIKRAIVGTRFSDETLRTKQHVDAAFDLMAEEFKAGDAEAPTKNPLADALLNGRSTTRSDRKDTFSLADAQEKYDARMRANLQ